MSGIELQGVDAMLAEIRRRYGNAAAAIEREALKSAGEIIATEERSLVNVSDRTTPHLGPSIYVTKVVRKDGLKYVLVRASKKTSWRIPFLEYGTSNMPARPFKDPAFHARKGEALQALADGFEKGLRQ